MTFVLLQHANNTRDEQNDRRAKVKTIALALEFESRFRLYVLLLGIAYSVIFVLALIHRWGLWFIFLSFPYARKLTVSFLMEVCSNFFILISILNIDLVVLWFIDRTLRNSHEIRQF